MKSGIHLVVCIILNQTYIVGCVQYYINHTLCGVSNIISDIHCLMCPILKQIFTFVHVYLIYLVALYVTCIVAHAVDVGNIIYNLYCSSCCWCWQHYI